jgi:hypothetical protein
MPDVRGLALMLSPLELALLALVLTLLLELLERRA